MNETRMYLATVTGKNGKTVTARHDLVWAPKTREQFTSDVLAAVAASKGANWIESYEIRAL